MSATWLQLTTVPDNVVVNCIECDGNRICPICRGSGLVFYREGRIVPVKLAPRKRKPTTYPKPSLRDGGRCG